MKKREIFSTIIVKTKISGVNLAINEKKIITEEQKKRPEKRRVVSLNGENQFYQNLVSLN